MSAEAFLSVEQQKGDPHDLDGRLTVYARVTIDTGDMLAMRHPVASMVHNGLLVAQGNFRDQNSLRDFLKSEMGLSLEEGLEQLLERSEGLEAALDPEKLREKIHDMSDMEEFIPTPAKIVTFHSQGEILDQEGDVYYAGEYANAGNAVLSVNAIPILYQARYREQVLKKVRSEIDSLIATVEQRGETPQSLPHTGEEVERRLLAEFFPALIYSRRDEDAFAAAADQLRTFMHGYRFSTDVDAILALVETQGELGQRESRLLELYARKIACVRSERFEVLTSIESQIRALEDGE